MKHLSRDGSNEAGVVKLKEKLTLHRDDEYRFIGDTPNHQVGVFLFWYGCSRSIFSGWMRKFPLYLSLVCPFFWSPQKSHRSPEGFSSFSGLETGSLVATLKRTLARFFFTVVCFLFWNELRSHSIVSSSVCTGGIKSRHLDDFLQKPYKNTTDNINANLLS